MGHRTIKRVPLDFGWPLNQVWEGYQNPHYQQKRDCPWCQGSGYTPRAKVISDQWYGNAPFSPRDTGSQSLTTQTPAVRAFATRSVQGSETLYYGVGEAAIEREARRLIGMWNTQWCHHLEQDDVDALIEAGRLMDFTHTVEGGKGWTPIEPTPSVWAQDVNEWSIGGMGHDSLNHYICVEARCKREGVELYCAPCEGEGELWPTPEVKAAYENWEASEPPVGEGWQLWETVSEGSPLSPVMASPEGLARWCESNASVFADEKLSYRQWFQMLTGEESLDAGSLMVSVVGDGETFVGSLANYNEMQRELEANDD